MSRSRIFIRHEDMSSIGILKLIVQEDGDIIVSVQSERNGVLQRGDAVEFSTIGNGGGRSPHTLNALRNLVKAIELEY